MLVELLMSKAGGKPRWRAWALALGDGKGALRFELSQRVLQSHGRRSVGGAVERGAR